MNVLWWWLILLLIFWVQGKKSIWRVAYCSIEGRWVCRIVQTEYSPWMGMSSKSLMWSSFLENIAKDFLIASISRFAYRARLACNFEYIYSYYCNKTCLNISHFGISTQFKKVVVNWMLLMIGSCLEKLGRFIISCHFTD